MFIRENTIIHSNYRLSKRIGSGGFSVVWLAEDINNDNEKYAIKIYAPQQGLNPDDIKLFEQEYQILSILSHEHIIETKEYFLLEDSPCIVLKYCSRGSLHGVVKTGRRLSEIEVAKLMVDIGGALHYLHTLATPIYHLDLKPENILIDGDANNCDKYVLTDFGISNEVRSTLLRRSNIVAETFSYRSPERALNHNLTEKHDIFSFGIVLMECCRGFFDAKFSLADSVLNGYDLPSIEGYSTRLLDIFNQIIQLEPNDRPSALDIFNYGTHFIENKFWPKIEMEKKTRRYDSSSNKDNQDSKLDLAEKKQEKHYIPLVLLLGLLSLFVLIYGFLQISKSKPVTQEIDNCQVLTNKLNDLLQRGNFLSVVNLSSAIANSCPNNVDLNAKVDFSKQCLSIFNSGNMQYEKKDYEGALEKYEYFKSCKCPFDSAGIVKARLDIIPEKLSTRPLIKNSIRKINEATRSPK